MSPSAQPQAYERADAYAAIMCGANAYAATPTTCPLSPGDAWEVLAFLDERPLHTVNRPASSATTGW